MRPNPIVGLGQNPIGQMSQSPLRIGGLPGVSQSPFTLGTQNPLSGQMQLNPGQRPGLNTPMNPL